jgi:hypothetical protein
MKRHSGPSQGPSPEAVEAFWNRHCQALRRQFDRQTEGIASPDLARTFALGSAKPERRLFSPLLLIPGIAAAVALVLFTPAFVRSGEPAVLETLVVDQVFESTADQPSPDVETAPSLSAYRYSPVLRTIERGFARWEDQPQLLN